MGNSKGNVFVSHSSKDKKIVDRIVSDLKKHDISVWYDKFEIKAGNNIVRQINEGLGDSKYFLLILSPNAISSSWVEEEMSFAIANQIMSNGTFIIPVLVDDCEIPPLLKHRKYVDFRKSYSQGIKELLEILSKDNNILKILGKEKLDPIPDINESDEEYVYLHSMRFDKVFKVPISMSRKASDLIDYIIKTCNLPWEKNLLELGISFSFSYSVLYKNKKIPLTKSLSESGVSKGDIVQLGISGTWSDLWEKELNKIWSGDKLYNMGGVLIRQAELRQLIKERGMLTEKRLKKIADSCFAHV